MQGHKIPHAGTFARSPKRLHTAGQFDESLRPILLVGENQTAPAETS